jgi:CubicO group peptidase (beta-lactamase class C family)
MQRDTLFRIASMTKPVTSVAALILMEEGKLALDDPITRWAPEFKDMRVLKSPTGPLDETYPAPREITIEDLMTHRAGLAYGFTSIGPIAYAHQKALGDVLDNTMTPDQWMEALGSLPLSYPPGDRFHYSHATDVLGFIVGRIAGTGFRQFLVDRIFNPLAMKDTDFYIPPQKRDRAAVVYRLDEDSGRLEPVPFRQYDAPPVFCGGGGGLVSTVDDYLRFARMLLGAGEVDGVRLLRAETVELMTTDRLTAAQHEVTFMGMPFWAGQGFGLGLSMVTDPEKQAWMGAGSKGAFGWPGAFGTWWQADPAEDMVILYMIQNSIPLGPEAAAQLATGQRMGARVALPMFQKLIYSALGREAL